MKTLQTAAVEPPLAVQCNYIHHNLGLQRLYCITLFTLYCTVVKNKCVKLLSRDDVIQRVSCRYHVINALDLHFESICIQIFSVCVVGNGILRRIVYCEYVHNTFILGTVCFLSVYHLSDSHDY